MEKSPVVLIDMDGVLADFDLAVDQLGLPTEDAAVLPNFYRDLPVMKGAL